MSPAALFVEVAPTAGYPKTCRDCKHMGGDWRPSDEWWCGKQRVQLVSLIDGHSRSQLCETVRADEGQCGRAGTWWEDGTEIRRRRDNERRRADQEHLDHERRQKRTAGAIAGAFVLVVLGIVILAQIYLP